MTWKFNWNPFAAKDAFDELKKNVKRDAAKFMLDRAKQYVPVDTGDLFRSIEIIAASGSATVHVVARMPYARYVEFGHIALPSTWVAPNPFMRKALADTKQAFPEIVGRYKFGSPTRDNDTQNLGVTFQTTT